MRKSPSAALVEVTAKQDSLRVTQVRQYRVITPLLGGGVNPKEADPVKVIRESGVRGQLRFWWRATRGTGTLDELRRREGALWGNVGKQTAQQSQVFISVSLNHDYDPHDANNRDAPFMMQGRNPRARFDSVAPSYAAFPLQPTKDEIQQQGINLPMREVLRNVEFTLTISFPSDAQKDVAAALWAWETFGGVGGRTRRGFGALQLLTVDGTEIKPPAVDEVKQKIKDGLDKHLTQEGRWDVAELPHLAKAAAIEMETRTAANCLRAWHDLIECLQRFRQSPRSGNNFKGRSHWPEADAVRRLTRRHATNLRDGSPDRVPQHKVGNKFPRAAFGLPIILHFKEANEGDPSDQEIKPVRHTRLASPLILRPIACAQGQAVGLAVILQTPCTPPHGVEVKRQPGTIVTDLAAGDIAHIKPMQQADPHETDVLRSFLKTLK